MTIFWLHKVRIVFGRYFRHKNSKSNLDDISATWGQNLIWMIFRPHEVKIEFGRYIGYMISKSYLDDISDTKVRNRIWTILRLHEVKIQIGLYFMYTKYKVEIEFGQYLGYKSSKSNFGRYFVYMWLNSNLNYILGTWGQNRILTIFRNQVFEIEFGRYFDYMRSNRIWTIFRLHEVKVQFGLYFG